MIKKQAHYRVTIYTNEETIIITDPITCHFNVTRGVLSDSSKASIKLYNLAPSTREKIFQDAYTFDWEKFKYIHLEAGYGESMSMIFKGRILQAYSHKSGGQTDIVTDIQAQALDIFDCQSSYTFKAGTTFLDAFQALAMNLPNVTIANVGVLNGKFQTDTTFEGNTYEQLQKLTGGNVIVDNGQLNCINPNEVIDVPVPVITDNSALLETPMRRDANLEVKMLFEPSLIVGQLLEIQSSVSPQFNGQFKVMGFTHDCTISEAQAGTRTTTVNLFIGPFLPQAPINVTGGEASAGGFNKVKGSKVIPVNASLPQNINEVYDYIQKNGYAPRTKVTNNIWWPEIVKYPSLNYGKPTLTQLKNLAYCSMRIQNFVDKYYKGARIQLNSGWRSRGYNNTLSNADPNSEHLYGNAIDFKLINYNTRSVYNVFEKYWKGRKYLHAGYDFIHADTTTKRGVYANDW